MIIILTAMAVTASCSIVGSLLMLRRSVLMADAISHAVLPGIILAFLVTGTNHIVPMMIGAVIFGVICVLGIEWLTQIGVVKVDAATGLVFPVLFSIGVLLIDRYAENVHIDLDSTILGSIEFAPFQPDIALLGLELPRGTMVTGIIALALTVVLVALWKELATSAFDPMYAEVAGQRPRLANRIVLVLTAIAAVAAFDAVGIILVIALIIIPPSIGWIVASTLPMMIIVSIGAGWLASMLGYYAAFELNVSISGMIGTMAFVELLVVAAITAIIRTRRRPDSDRRTGLEILEHV